MHNVHLDAQAVTLKLIEPDPTSQPFPCPNQILVYQCTADRHIGLSWILSNSSLYMSFSSYNMTGFTRNSFDGQFRAAWISSEPVGTEGVFPLRLITSILLINPPLDALDGLTLICEGFNVSHSTSVETNITLNGE